MESRIGVRRSGCEVLPDHEHRLTMRHRTRALEVNIGRQRDIAGHTLPHEVERVFGSPDISAAAGDSVFAAAIFDGALLGCHADVAAGFKIAGLCPCRACQQGRRSKNSEEVSDRHSEASIAP